MCWTRIMNNKPIDLIDRNRLIDSIKNIYATEDDCGNLMLDISDVLEVVNELPSEPKTYLQEDGTLIVTVEGYSKVKRVLVKDVYGLDGGLYYHDIVAE